MAKIKRASNLFIYWIAILFSAIFSFLGRSVPLWADEVLKDHNAQAFEEKYRVAENTPYVYSNTTMTPTSNRHSAHKRKKSLTPAEMRGKAVTPADTRGKAVTPADTRGKAVTPADTRGKAVTPADPPTKVINPNQLQGKPSSQLERQKGDPSYDMGAMELPRSEDKEIALNQQFGNILQDIQLKIDVGEKLTPEELSLLKTSDNARAIEDLTEQVNLLILAIQNMKQG